MDNNNNANNNGLYERRAQYTTTTTHTSIQQQKRCHEYETNPLLHYLLLRKKEADLLDLPAYVAAALTVEGLQPGPDDGTMRGTDPLGCPTLHRWYVY